MNRHEALTRLKALEPSLKARGIESLYLFGSTALDRANADSDVDLFYDRNPGARMGFALAAIKHDIEDALGVSVDLAPRRGLHPLIKEDVEAAAIQVF